MGLVLLVRHGQASFGADDYDVLSETGWEQSRTLGRALAEQGLEPAALVHGEMRRQRDTLVAMGEAAGWSVAPSVDPGWNEFDHLGVVASWARLGTRDLDLDDPKGFQRAFEQATARWTGGEHDEEYDEPWPAFLSRIRDALVRACDNDGVTIVSTSGGPVGAACATLISPDADPVATAHLWGSFNTVTANSSVTRVISGSRGRRLLTFNEHTHLPRELVTYR